MRNRNAIPLWLLLAALPALGGPGPWKPGAGFKPAPTKPAPTEPAPTYRHGFPGAPGPGARAKKRPQPASSHAAREGGAGAGEKNDPQPALRRRDPFAALVSDDPGHKNVVIRPPGKAGLMIDEIDIQGTVQAAHGAVAVVSSRGGHVYFLRPGDRLFDGTVERIDLHDVVFIQHVRDAFGRTFDHRVTKAVQPAEGAKP